MELGKVIYLNERLKIQLSLWIYYVFFETCLFFLVFFSELSSESLVFVTTYYASFFMGCLVYTLLRFHRNSKIVLYLTEITFCCIQGFVVAIVSLIRCIHDGLDKTPGFIWYIIGLRTVFGFFILYWIIRNRVDYNNDKINAKNYSTVRFSANIRPYDPNLLQSNQIDSNI